MRRVEYFVEPEACQWVVGRCQMASLSERDSKTWIRPSTGRPTIALAELWRYRELAFFLIWRDVKVRYKQTALGVTWAVVQPVASMLVFALFFGRLAGMPSDGVPYALFSLAALVPWALFAQGMSQAANSVIGSADLIQKVYFPRLVIPIAAVGAGVVEFFFGFAVLVGMMPFYGVRPTGRALWLPVFVVLALAASLAVGLWLAALSSRYRDVRHLVPFLSQLWLFATPVAYPSSLVPPTWRPLYGVNPMVGVIDGFRWALLGTETGPGPTLAVSVAVTLVILVTGALYFRRMERVVADVV
jgi:homopolymeric O-antigen transport system permease protein